MNLDQSQTSKLNETPCNSHEFRHSFTDFVISHQMQDSVRRNTTSVECLFKNPLPTRRRGVS